MMSEEIAKKAEDCVGMHRNEVRCSGSHAWCADFVSYVLNEVGIDLYDVSCTKMQKKMSDSPEWDEPEDYMMRGDIIFFDWDRDPNEALPLDHTGVVVDFDPQTHTVTYVNGNGSSRELVTKQTINGDSKQIVYWMRYVGDRTSHPPDVTASTFQPNERRVLRRGAKGEFVKSLQQLLFMKGYAVGADDGDFGAKTENCVRKFQRDRRLDVDGIVGIQTFEELIGK